MDNYFHKRDSHGHGHHSRGMYMNKTVTIAEQTIRFMPFKLVMWKNRKRDMLIVIFLYLIKWYQKQT